MTRRRPRLPLVVAVIVLLAVVAPSLGAARRSRVDDSDGDREVGTCVAENDMGTCGERATSENTISAETQQWIQETFE